MPAFQPPEITTLKMSVTAVFNPFYCKIKYRYIKVYTKKIESLMDYYKVYTIQSGNRALLDIPEPLLYALFQ